MLIIELNGLREEAIDNEIGIDYITPFRDYDSISDWAKLYVNCSHRKGLMKGESDTIFNPKGIVTGKQLSAVMLRALGYQDVPWNDVAKKLAELNIPIKDEALTRGQAFDYMWDVINKPLTKEGLTLAYQLGKIVPGITLLPELLGKNPKERMLDSFRLTYNARYAVMPYNYCFVNDKAEHVLIMTSSKQNKCYIFTLTKDWKLISTLEKPFEGELFGGFYKGKDYYYMVFGNKNEEEDDNKAVLTLVKYDKDFKKLDSLDIKNAYTTEPFAAGNFNMAEKDGYLAIHTSRRRYLTPEDGLRHQSQLTVVVDTKEMKVLNDLGPFQTNHVGHSFDQYVFYDEQDRLIFFDHGDGYPRSIVLQVLNKDGRGFYRRDVEVEYYTDVPYYNYEKEEGTNYFELLKFPRNDGANVTGTSIGNVVEGPTCYLLGTNRMDYTKDEVGSYYFDSYKVVDKNGEDPDYRNVFIDFVNKKDFSFTTKQLTSDANKQSFYSAPKIVPLKNDKFMVLWERGKIKTSEEKEWFVRDRMLQYTVIDEEGKLITPIKNLLWHRLYSMNPVYDNGKVFWIGVDNSGYLLKKDPNGHPIRDYRPRLYTIDVDPAWLK